MSHVREYCCPSCGVIVLSGNAVAHDPSSSEDVCVLCAPYDEKREDFSILLLDDALEQSLYSSSLGAKQIQPPSRPQNAMISPDQAKTAIEVNDFAKMLLEILYGDAKFGTTNQFVLQSGKQILGHINMLIRAKLLDPSQAGRLTPLIVTKEDTDRYLGILELLHTRYTNVHKIFVGDAANPEEARRLSYAMFWHIGSLIRVGQLATTISPWITGEQKPRF